MNPIEPVREMLPDKAAFRDFAARAEQDLKLPVRRMDYQWQNGRVSAEVRLARGGGIPAPLPDTEGRFQSVAGEAEYSYLLFLPEGYDPAQSYPALLFLHGIGERGDDPARIIPYGPFQYILGGARLGMIVIAPQLEAGFHWVEDSNARETDAQMKRLALFLEQMRRRYAMDASRIYLTGLSMGGRGAYKLACYLPDTFAAVAACCGRAGSREHSKALFYDLRPMARLPVWLIHGLDDATVDANHTLSAMRELLRLNENGSFRMTLYPGVGHESYDLIYRDGELYSWFLQWQKKKQTRESL